MSVTTTRRHVLGRVRRQPPRDRVRAGHRTGPGDLGLRGRARARDRLEGLRLPSARLLARPTAEGHLDTARSVCQVGGLDVFSAPADMRAGRPADRRRPVRAYSRLVCRGGPPRTRGRDASSPDRTACGRVESGTGGLRASITETICAFANLPGSGLIVVGLDEAGGFASVGLESAGTLSAGIASRARHACEPRFR